MANPRGTKNRTTDHKRQNTPQRQAAKVPPQQQTATVARAAEPATSSRAAQRAQEVRDRRAERQRQYQRNKRELMIWKIVGAIAAIGLVLAIGFGIYSWGQDRQLNRQPEGAVAYQYVGGQHIEGEIDYASLEDYQGEIPPAGGAHSGASQPCGTFDAPVQWETTLHTLEHGAVWIAYRSDLPADQIEDLKELGDAPEMIVAPEERLTAPIVVTSWNHQYVAQSADDENIRRFIRFYKNHEDAPEAAAGCAMAE